MNKQTFHDWLNENFGITIEAIGQEKAIEYYREFLEWQKTQCTIRNIELHEMQVLQAMYLQRIQAGIEEHPAQKREREEKEKAKGHLKLHN